MQHGDFHWFSIAMWLTRESALQWSTSRATCHQHRGDEIRGNPCAWPRGDLWPCDHDRASTGFKSNFSGKKAPKGIRKHELYAKSEQTLVEKTWKTSSRPIAISVSCFPAIPSHGALRQRVAKDFAQAGEDRWWVTPLQQVTWWKTWVLRVGTHGSPKWCAWEIPTRNGKDFVGW